MPVYEFDCSDCGKRFSELCRIQWEGTVKCPVCGGTNLAKAISRFSAFGVSGGQSGCGSCSGKNCSGCR